MDELIKKFNELKEYQKKELIERLILESDLSSHFYLYDDYKNLEDEIEVLNDEISFLRRELNEKENKENKEIKDLKFANKHLKDNNTRLTEELELRTPHGLRGK